MRLDINLNITNNPSVGGDSIADAAEKIIRQATQAKGLTDLITEGKKWFERIMGDV
jgi:hypothetical protein